MADELNWLSAREMTRRFAEGELSPVDVLEATLARLHAVNPSLNAVVVDLTSPETSSAIRAFCASGINVRFSFVFVRLWPRTSAPRIVSLTGARSGAGGGRKRSSSSSRTASRKLTGR